MILSKIQINLKVLREEITYLVSKKKFLTTQQFFLTINKTKQFSLGKNIFFEQLFLIFFIFHNLL